MAQQKTPGVYIVEQNAFPNSVVQVATAVPAFVGYTERAKRGTRELWNVPTRISSLAEFELLFGGRFKTTYSRKNGKVEADRKTVFHLYNAMRLFFDNGGGPCWIVAVGPCAVPGTEPAEAADKKKSDFETAWGVLAKEQEPTMIVVPDAVLLEPPDWQSISQAALDHCVALRSRIAILDVFDGATARTRGDDDVISGGTGFRSSINSDFPSFAVAYYPFVNTNIVEAAELDYTNFDKVSIDNLAKEVTDEIQKALAPKDAPDQDPPQNVLDQIAKIKETETDAASRTKNHQALMALSVTYREAMAEMLHAANVMPPSAAIAGVYARTDATLGVFKAPANTAINSVLSPTVTISNADQEDLNIPLDGKAINAIRTFIGRGVLIWGARTLDGNSQDWRYVSVRRTLIMLEQSIRFAAEAFVFAPNSASTWVTVKNTIGNFLNNQWKAGALVGATPAEAYSVDVGLGSTMTANDILDGYMRVTVKVAVVRPAEFIIITFQQKMQTS